MEGRHAQHHPRLPGLGILGYRMGDTQALAAGLGPPGKGVQKGSRQRGLCSLRTLVRVRRPGVSAGDPSVLSSPQGWAGLSGLGLGRLFAGCQSRNMDPKVE